MTLSQIQTFTKPVILKYKESIRKYHRAFNESRAQKRKGLSQQHKCLRSLADHVPHGYRRKSLFEVLIRNNVPLLRFRGSQVVIAANPPTKDITYAIDRLLRFQIVAGMISGGLGNVKRELQEVTEMTTLHPNYASMICFFCSQIDGSIWQKVLGHNSSSLVEITNVSHDPLSNKWVAKASVHWLIWKWCNDILHYFPSNVE